jgi:hypothetical protein
MDTCDVSDWEGLQSALHFERLANGLRAARSLASKPDAAAKLSVLFKLLPEGIRKVVASDDPALHCYAFEVMWTLVELAVAVLANPAAVDLLSLIKLLESLAVVFDSTSQFYKSRRESHKRRNLTVCLWRLGPALQVPGFFIEVFTKGRFHYFCVKKGVNYVGEGCECCKPSPEADAALVNLTWLLSSGHGYDHILRMLSVPREYSLLAVELLLRPLVHLVEYNVGSKRLMEFTEGGFNKRATKTEFKNLCFYVCSELYRYLDDVLRAKEFNPCPNFETEYAAQWTFSDVLHHVHAIASWGVTYYGGSIAFESVRAAVCRLQEKMWERMLDAKRFSMACSSVGAAVEASLAPSPGYVWTSLPWMIIFFNDF